MIFITAINGFLGFIPAAVWAIALAGALATGCVEKLRFDHLTNTVKVEKAQIAIAQVEAMTKQVTADNAATQKRVETVTVYKKGATQFIKETIHEAAENPSPIVCDAPAERVSRFNAAIDAANKAGRSNDTVP